jgi:hypothetical protein
MNDTDRWINSEGPEPPWVRDLLDAARDVREVSREDEARMKRAIHQALDEQERKSMRRRRWAWAAAGSVVVAVTAAASLAIWLRAAHGPAIGPAAVVNAIGAPPVSPQR